MLQVQKVMYDNSILRAFTYKRADDLRYCITKESMVIVKQQLIRLTKKNKEINASIRTMRESSVDELLSIMRTRKILIDQLGRDDLPDELRVLCLGALPTRKMHFYLKEEELVSVEELLFGHETVLEYARSACLELEIKIETFEDAVKRTGKPGFSMDGTSIQSPSPPMELY